MSIYSDFGISRKFLIVIKTEYNYVRLYTGQVIFVQNQNGQSSLTLLPTTLLRHPYRLSIHYRLSIIYLIKYPRSSVSRTIRALTGSHSRHCVQPYRSLYTYYTLYLLMRRSSLTHSCSGRAHICIVHIFGMRACVRIRVRLSLRDVQQLVLELLVKRNHSYVCLYTYYVLRIAK